VCQTGIDQVRNGKKNDAGEREGGGKRLGGRRKVKKEPRVGGERKQGRTNIMWKTDQRKEGKRGGGLTSRLQSSKQHPVHKHDRFARTLKNNNAENGTGIKKRKKGFKSLLRDAPPKYERGKAKEKKTWCVRFIKMGKKSVAT